MVMLLHDNLLPKYKQILLLMMSKTPAEFEDKLNTAMAFMQTEDEEQLVTTLADLFSKAVVSTKPPAAAAPEQQPNKPTTLMSAANNEMDHADGDADDRDAELAYDPDYAYDADDWCDPDYTFDTDHDMDQYEVDYYGAEGYDYYDDYDNCEYEY